MMTVPTYLAASPIEGIGLFAAEPVAKGTVIWTPQYERAFPPGEVADMPPLFREFVARYGYLLENPAGIWACSLDNSRFMNHDAANPSAVPDGAVYVAARDLAAGDELTYDYGDGDPSGLLRRDSAG
jgi:SET domain-containing protein